jgi:hypothetical protein
MLCAPGVSHTRLREAPETVEPVGEHACTIGKGCNEKAIYAWAMASEYWWRVSLDALVNERRRRRKPHSRFSLEPLAFPEEQGVDIRIRPELRQIGSLFAGADVRNRGAQLLCHGEGDAALSGTVELGNENV